MIRVFDILFSIIVVIVLFPFLIIIAAVIKITTAGDIFFIQKRVGQSGKDFNLYKFRTMHKDADTKGLLTVGGRDSRITKVGYLLRKFKVDELPQLINIIAGDMSIVGPRPEVRKYVQMYDDEQLKVLYVKPGLTDFASLEFINENELLAMSSNPEQLYIEKIMPAKLLLNKKFIDNRGIKIYFEVIIKTIKKIFFER